MKLAASFTCLLSLGLFCSSCSTRNDLAQFGDFRMTAFDNQAGAPAAMGAGTETTLGVQPVLISATVPQQAATGQQLRAAIPKDFVVKTTAYTHLEADSLQYGTKSAAGSNLQYGHVRSAAADWSRYPLGTRFKIKGLPYEYVVDDYGSALVGTDTIDLYKPNHSTMDNWGARDVGIKVLQWGSFEESRKILKERKEKAVHVKEMLEEIDKKIDAIPPELRKGFRA